ncbi:hypothetical protein AKJ62_04780 [candidate division MSBL1 archaeon SCGC-AAA259D14]|uniref:Fe-S hydro-lyase tartrate dehydratase beta-type catalytic domain-containing protein n=1 Tax=candidate division MSBL1 archaeon SCGC-AAA259D14 TaxID=1698261 RepID=A0A133U374_9EURY|nr:hypothetical protein AKJ62_04780 [candidate division MSBL1 archaeon SCGC-AAA259D14]
MVKSLKPPLSKKTVSKLNAGDSVTINGTIYVLRDEAEKRIFEYIKTSKKVPMHLDGAILFHSGPIITKMEEKWKTVALGPTTTARINDIAPKIIEKTGISGIIGKGGLGKESLEAMEEYGCVYIAFPGGSSAFGSAAVVNVQEKIWEDLVEPVWKIEVKNLGPLTVAMDSKGKTLYRNSH